MVEFELYVAALAKSDYALDMDDTFWLSSNHQSSQRGRNSPLTGVMYHVENIIKETGFL